MSTEKLEKMKVKISALLAKAEATTHSEEAETYRWKATELMQRYGVEQHQIKKTSTAVDEMVIWRYDVNPKGGHAYWRASCAAHIAEAFGCAVIFFNMRAGSKFPAVEIYGPESMISQLKIVVPLLMIHAEAGGLKAGKERRKDYYAGKPVWYTKTELANEATKYVNEARRAYVQGFGLGAAERIRSLRTDVDHSVDIKGTEVALVDIRSKSTAFMNSKWDKLGTLKPKPVHDGQAYAKGYYAGKAVDTGQNNIGHSRQEIS